MVICLERGADVHTAQLMPLPLTVSCFTKIQIYVTFLVPAHLGSPRKKAIKRVCVCVCAICVVCLFISYASLLILFLHFFLTYLLPYLYFLLRIDPLRFIKGD